MKRIIAIFLTLGFILSMSACGISSDSEIKKPSDVNIGESNDGESQPPEQTNDQETSGNQEAVAPEDVIITEQVLVDEAGVKITAKELVMDELFGPEIKLLIENNSGKDLTFQSRNTSVNGYMVETMMSVEVVNGKKANDSLTFMDSDLELCGIETIADMEFAFHIFTTEDWDDYLTTSQIQIKTSAADTYEYTVDDSGDVAYEGNDMKVVVKGLAEDDSIFGPSIVVYIENNRDQDITVQTRDVSINGFMVDAVFSSDVNAGKRAVDSITFMSSDLEENGISAIESVELSFHIFDADDWDTIVDTEVITITF